MKLGEADYGVKLRIVRTGRVVTKVGKSGRWCLVRNYAGDEHWENNQLAVEVVECDSHIPPKI